MELPRSILSTTSDKTLWRECGFVYVSMSERVNRGYWHLKSGDIRNDEKHLQMCHGRTDDSDAESLKMKRDTKQLLKMTRFMKLLNLKDNNSHMDTHTLWWNRYSRWDLALKSWLNSQAYPVVDYQQVQLRPVSRQFWWIKIYAGTEVMYKVSLWINK